MNIVNNANNNNNNRNNNNNENNDNNDNINIANLNSQQMNMQFVMAGEKEVVEKEEKRTKDEISRSRIANTSISLQGAQWSNWECGQVNNISRIIIVDIADCLLDAPPLLKRQTKAVMHKMRTAEEIMNFSSGFRVGAAYLELWYRVQSASTPCVLALVCQVDVDQNLDG